MRVPDVWKRTRSNISVAGTTNDGFRSDFVPANASGIVWKRSPRYRRNAVAICLARVAESLDVRSITISRAVGPWNRRVFGYGDGRTFPEAAARQHRYRLEARVRPTVSRISTIRTDAFSQELFRLVENDTDRTARSVSPGLKIGQRWTVPLTLHRIQIRMGDAC